MVKQYPNLRIKVDEQASMIKEVRTTVKAISARLALIEENVAQLNKEARDGNSIKKWILAAVVGNALIGGPNAIVLLDKIQSLLGGS